MRILVVVAALVLAAPIRAGAAPPRSPCRGCIVEVPERARGRVPLLVVLHGDRETAAAAAERWRAAARAEGWAMLALQCPASEGCRASWWQWSGDPAWLVAQVDRLAGSLAIDRGRVVLAGWSGGATYIGTYARAWPARFAALVIHGGGQPPDDDRCPARRLPAYFLVGDRNPMHGATRRLRAYFDHCEHDVVWDLVRGADHAREDRTLDRAKAIAILGWAHAQAGARPPRWRADPGSAATAAATPDAPAVVAGTTSVIRDRDRRAGRPDQVRGRGRFARIAGWLVPRCFVRSVNSSATRGPRARPGSRSTRSASAVS